MGLDQDSLYWAMRVTYDQAEQDVRSAFGVLSKQAGGLTVDAKVDPGSLSAANALTTAKAQNLALDRATKEVLAQERLLLEEILRLEFAGLDSKKARAVLDNRADLSLAQQEKRLSEVVALRKTELGLTAELAREQLILQRNAAGAATATGAQKQSLALGEVANEQARLNLLLKKSEVSLEKEIALAKSRGIDVTEAQAVLDQRRSLLSTALVKDAQAEVAARQIALQSQQAQLSLLNKQYGLAHAEGRRREKDALGKSFGGIRALYPIKDGEDLLKSFTTLEALKARTLSLFSGQIGTLFLYAAAFKAVSSAYGVVITRNVELQKELQRLSVVVDAEAGKHEQVMRGLRQEAIDWSGTHGRKVQEIVAAYYDLGAAGLATSLILKGAFAGLLLSEGGFIKHAESVELLQAAYQTFAREGNSFIDLANITQTTAAESAVTVEELATAYKYAAASAQAANTSFRELNALLGTLANLGLRGSIAGTSLNQVFTQIVKKRKEIEALGIQVVGATGQMRPFVDILEDFKRVFGGFLSAGEQGILKDIFNVRGARAMERLIQDTTNLPKLMKDLEGSSDAAFLAAEKGANTASEAVKVLGNQIANLVLIDQLPEVLRDTFDALTNRRALRAAENISSSAQGAQYELNKLIATQLASADAADYWAIKLALAGDKVDGKLGDALRRYRGAGDLFGRQLFAVVGLGDAFDQWISKTRDLSGFRAELTRLLEETVQTTRAAEDLAKAGDIIRATFGSDANLVVPISAEFAGGLEGLDKSSLAEFAEAQAKAAEAALDPSLSAVVSRQARMELMALAKLWRRLAADLGKESDVSEDQERLRQAKLVSKSRIDSREAEIRALEAFSGLEFSLQREAARARGQLTREQLDQEFGLKLLALQEEYGLRYETDENYQKRKAYLEDEFRSYRIASERETANRVKEINLRELEELYGMRARLAEQEKRLALANADAGQVTTLQRGFAEREFLLRGNQLVAELNAGGITLERFAQEFSAAENEYELAIAGLGKADRAREAELLELGGNVAVQEARALVKRVDQFRAFQRERTEIHRQYELQRAMLELQYADDEAMRLLKQRELYFKMQGDLTASTLSEEEARRQVMLDSISLIGHSFGQFSELMTSLSNDSTAAMLSNIGSVVDAAGQAVDIIDRMKMATLSTTAGVIGIAGLFVGVMAQFLTRRRTEDEQVRMLADEFRSVEGRTPTADFGRAQVINARIEVNAQYRSLTAPNAREQQILVEELGPEILEELRSLGANL